MLSYYALAAIVVAGALLRRHRRHVVALALERSLRSAERLAQRLRTREGVLVAALLIAAAALRLPLMTFRGYYRDLATYVRWGDLANQGLATLYSSSTAGGGFPGGPGG